MKKGFTLVELLAVIVILAVILVIAIPQINNVIKQTKKNSLASTAKLIASKAEEKEVENQALENNESLSCASLVKLDDNYGSCTVSVTNGVATVTIEGTGKFANITCTGTKSNMNCTEETPIQTYYLYINSDDGDTMPHIWNKYIITDRTACRDFFESFYMNNGHNAAASESAAIDMCDGENEVDGYNEELTRTLNNEIFYGNFTDADINSFVRKDGIIYNEASLNYTDMKYYQYIQNGNNEWVPDEGHTNYAFFRATVNSETNEIIGKPEVCITYRGNSNSDLNCFKWNNYEYEKNHLQEVYGVNNCEIQDEGGSYESLQCGDTMSDDGFCLLSVSSHVQCGRCTGENRVFAVTDTGHWYVNMACD